MVLLSMNAWPLSNCYFKLWIIRLSNYYYISTTMCISPTENQLIKIHWWCGNITLHLCWIYTARNLHVGHQNLICFLPVNWQVSQLASQIANLPSCLLACKPLTFRYIDPVFSQWRWLLFYIFIQNVYLSLLPLS